MPSRWITGLRRTANPGSPSCFVVLLDISSSMHGAGFRHLAEALRQIGPALPHIRIFAFAEGVIETSADGLLDHLRLEDTPQWINSRLNGQGTETVMSRGIEAISRLSPCHTIIVSDGGVSAEDRGLTIETARALPGRIDCFFCGSRFEFYQPWPHPDVALLRKIARLGGGTVFCTAQFHSAGHYAQAIRERFGIVAQRRFHHHYAPDIHIHHED